jgi:hypothetical protein
VPQETKSVVTGEWEMFFAMLKLHQHVHVATHEAGRILDLILTDLNFDEQSDVKVTVTNGISDHNSILIDITMKKYTNVKSGSRSSHRCYKRIVKADFKNDLHTLVTIPALAYAAEISLSIVIEQAQTSHIALCQQYSDHMFHLLTTSMRDVLDKHAPLRQSKTSHHPSVPWWTPDLLRLRHCLRSAEKDWRQSRLDVHQEIYKNCKHLYHAAIKKAKRLHLQSKVEKLHHDPKQLWKELNRSLGRKVEQKLPQSQSDCILAEKFIEFFPQKVQKICESLPITWQHISSVAINDSYHPLSLFLPATEFEIKKIMQSAPRKSDIIDPMPTWLLLQYIDVLLPAITVMVNCALLYGMPSPCKVSIIRPLLKKKGADIDCFDNYRPVSNLPYIAKVIERVISCRLTQHMEVNGLMDPHQSAYRKMHSCETALLSVLNYMQRAIDRKRITVLALYDLTAAFDTVEHKQLLDAIMSIGLNGMSLNWMTDYMSNRSQSVMIRDTLSSSSRITCGVPQGSVLGPILFCIYMRGIHDLFSNEKMHYMLYADDIQVVIEDEPANLASAMREMQETAEKISTWLTKKRLKLNAAKTEVMVVGGQKALKNIEIPERINILGTDIGVSQVVRNLGILIDRSLTMDQQVTKVCSTAFSYLRIIGKVRESLTPQTRMKLVHALVSSRIEFGAALLMGTKKSNIIKLQRILNASIRVAYGNKKGYSEELPQMLTVENLIKFRLLCTVHKIIQSGTPAYLHKMLLSYVPGRPLRSSDSNLLQVPVVNSEAGERSFSRTAPKLWNSLPLNIRSISSFMTFRKNLLNHLLLSGIT